MLKYALGANTEGNNVTITEKAAVGGGSANAFSVTDNTIGANGISQNHSEGWKIGDILGHSTQDSAYTNVHGVGSSHTESTTIAGHTITDTNFFNVNAGGVHAGETLNGHTVLALDLTSHGLNIDCCGESANCCEPCNLLAACLPSVGDCCNVVNSCGFGECIDFLGQCIGGVAECLNNLG